ITEPPVPNTDQTQPQITPPNSDPDAALVRPGDGLPGGTLVIPGYDLLPEIARGGMGVVYAARDRAFDREVAIKVMKPGMNATEFVREARITGRLPHPGIPPVYALGELPDGRPYLAMKLIRGDTLDTVLKRRTEFVTDRGRLLAAFEQMCHAVGYAHAQGLIHRDLKPSNVMVGAFGEVQVMDWGLAREVGSGQPAVGSEEQAGTPTTPDATDDALKTVAGQIKGTPAYMAPEQARGEPVDARADVFALGGILAAILTGHPPFAGNSVMDTIIRAAQAELSETLARLDESGADAELLALCKTCLAAKADDRHANATELAQAVAAYRAEVEERLLQAERERAAEEARAREEENTRREAEARAAADRKRRFAQRALAASVLLLLLAGGVGVAFASLWRTAETQRDAADIAKNDALTEKDKADIAKAEAEKQRLAAEKAEGVAVEQKRIAEQAKTNEEIARKQVEQEREKLASVEYGRTIQVAHQECLANNQEGARALLDGTRQDFRKWEWHYVNHLANSGLLLTLKGHTRGVRAAAFSADGTRIVTGSGDNTAKVWDAKTGAEVLTLKGHTDGVNAASFSADGTRVVTGSDDKTAKVWDAKTGAEVLTLKGHTSSVTAASFSADGTRIVTGSGDKTAKVWDAKTGAEVLTLKGHTNDVRAASFSADGIRIVTGSGDQTAKVWDAKTGAEVLTLKGHTGGVRAASFSADGTRIVTGSDDKTAKVWDAKTGAEVLTLKGHTNDVRAASFSADGIRIVTGSGDQTAKVWEVPSGKPEGIAKTGAEVLTLKGHTGGVTAASFSADGTRIVTGSFDNTAKVWDAKTGAEVLALKGYTGMVLAASFSADGTRIVTGSYDKTAKVWDAKTGAEVLTLKGHTGGVKAASFSADGTRIVTGTFDNTAKVWYAPPPPEVALAPRSK
ncbi:MAG: hypothetical protein FJ304_26605, partial [Planctomycetes bacterium]|nr:hypothetical protein [Planctomycetota bacterium]